MPSKESIGRSYAGVDAGSGNPPLAGSREPPPVLAKPVGEIQLVVPFPTLKECCKLARGSLAIPMLPPNWSVCCPFVQEKSSRQLLTGVCALELEVERGQNPQKLFYT